MLRFGHSLDTLVRRAEKMMVVRKADLRAGDWVVVKTFNSVYRMRVEGDDFYQVTGGWFDQNGQTPERLKIVGCTWGGSIVKIDIIAARGLCLEFSNRVVTSPVQKIWRISVAQQN
ncbi:MAG: hypothetical protein H6695_18485 [Deferribacteres bacterium]|nr:hypothetical protein [candidate division KSB1 bacterium]MCB9512173.1 hypothetical protein [Deferribacteres bacterium]